jgi:hypothetical protein
LIEKISYGIYSDWGGYMRYFVHLTKQLLNTVDRLRMNLLDNKIERLFDEIEEEQDIEIRSRIRGCATKLISLHHSLYERVLERQRSVHN